MGTSVNILLLTERLRNKRKREGECCLFLDYKSAYNTVNRKQLCSIMKRKKILSDNEIDFLEGLHEALYFKCGSQRFYLKNGVHQGSPISSALFDIYMEEVIEQLKTRYDNFTFWYKLYADDVVISVNHLHLD